MKKLNRVSKLWPSLLILSAFAVAHVSFAADEPAKEAPAASDGASAKDAVKDNAKEKANVDVKASAEKKKSPAKTTAKSKDKLAVIHTTAGDITVKLFAEKAPKTVENFVGLANGKKEWTDPKTKEKVKGKALYNGTIFHRIIPGFMIQGGDPLGNGTGGPGYEFEDEFKADDAFDKPGVLAMANAGPNTNGSQFFITVVPTPHLNGRHTIFGQVTRGMNVVEKIVSASKGAQDMPNDPVKIKSISVK